MCVLGSRVCLGEGAQDFITQLPGAFFVLSFFVLLVLLNFYVSISVEISQTWIFGLTKLCHSIIVSTSEAD